jgi:DmsE family decaheme c-type cytochrome
VAAIFVWAALLAGQPAFGQAAAPSQNQAEAPGKAQVQQAQAPAAAEYMTSGVCQGCHEDIFNAFMKKNAHRIVETDAGRGWAEKACESCHGPGSKHAESMAAEDILNPAKMQPGASNRVCLTCHLNQPTQVGRIMSGHSRNQVRCSTCHPIHEAATQVQGKRLLPGSVQANVSPESAARTASCIQCHSDVWAQFMRPYRHKLPEGAMTCTDCHNPHGGTNRSMWQNASMREPGCFQCHGNIRGPFTFEHAPVRVEGCSTCHQPHGSANPRMLTRSEVRFQCLECHSNIGSTAGAAESNALGGVPPAFHDLRSPRFRNCTTCHIKIHGSYIDRGLTR